MTEVDAFLEHHGIKGQKWGIRNRKPKQPKSAYYKKQRNANLAILGLAAVTAGALLAHRILANKASLKISSIRTSPYKGYAEEAIKKHRHDILSRHALKSIPMGPIGSSGVSRLRGAIPL